MRVTMQASAVKTTVKRARLARSVSAESAKGRQRSELVAEWVGLGRIRRGPVEFSLVSLERAERIFGVPTSPGQSFPENRSPNQSLQGTPGKVPFPATEAGARRS